MSVEVGLILTGLWVLLGLIDAWVLHQLGRRGWRIVALCAVAGPLSLSIVYDEVRTVRTEAPEQEASEQAFLDDADDTAPTLGQSLDWPTDDPEGRFILEGYRGLSDH
jgi:hypothetical protein